MKTRFKLRKSYELILKLSTTLVRAAHRLIRHAAYCSVVAIVSGTICVASSRAVIAEPFRVVFEVRYPVSDGGSPQLFRVSLISRCIGSTVVYKIRNLGERWPERANLAFFRTGENAPLIFKDIVLDRGQTVTFRIYTEERYPAIDMRIKATWLGQTVFHRSQHKHRSAQLSGKQPKSTKVFKRHVAYIAY